MTCLRRIGERRLSSVHDLDHQTLLFHFECPNLMVTESELVANIKTWDILDSQSCTLFDSPIPHPLELLRQWFQGECSMLFLHEPDAHTVLRALESFSDSALAVPSSVMMDSGTAMCLTISVIIFYSVKKHIN